MLGIYVVCNIICFFFFLSLMEMYYRMNKKKTNMRCIICKGKFLRETLASWKYRFYKIIISVLTTLIDIIVIFFPFLRFHPWLLQSQWAYPTVCLTTFYCILHASNPYSFAMFLLMYSNREVEILIQIMQQVGVVCWLFSCAFWTVQACHFPHIFFFFSSIQQMLGFFVLSYFFSCSVPL